MGLNGGNVLIFYNYIWQQCPIARPAKASSHNGREFTFRSPNVQNIEMHAIRVEGATH